MTKRFLALTFAALTLFAQDPTLKDWYGVPCAYNYGPNVSSNGQLGCWADADCNDGKYLQVAVYQYWNCAYSIVNGSGNSVLLNAYVFTPQGTIAVPTGVGASGLAELWDTFDGAFDTSYNAYNQMFCTSGDNSSNLPFEYSC